MTSVKTWLYVLIIGSTINGCAILADALAVAIGRPPNVMFAHVIIVGDLIVLLSAATMGFLAAVLKLMQRYQ